MDGPDADRWRHPSSWPVYRCRLRCPLTYELFRTASSSVKPALEKVTEAVDEDEQELEELRDRIDRLNDLTFQAIAKGRLPPVAE